MTTRKFIPNYRFTCNTNPRFCKIASIPVSSRVILINIRFFCCAETFALIFVFDYFCRIIPIFFDWNNFGNNNIAVFDFRIFRDKSMCVQFVVIAVFDGFGFGGIGFTPNDFISNNIFIFIFFGVIDGGQKQSTVDGGFIDQHAILLIVSGVRHNGHMNLASRRNTVEL